MIWGPNLKDIRYETFVLSILKFLALSPNIAMKSLQSSSQDKNEKFDFAILNAPKISTDSGSLAATIFLSLMIEVEQTFPSLLTKSFPSLWEMEVTALLVCFLVSLCFRSSSFLCYHMKSMSYTMNSRLHQQFFLFCTRVLSDVHYYLYSTANLHWNVSLEASCFTQSVVSFKNLDKNPVKNACQIYKRLQEIVNHSWKKKKCYFSQLKKNNVQNKQKQRC